ncbi:hypothetical protein ONE63_000057 [Megalurothrips usitatus]|uniref:Uncharacterized protein n=1 Tax=Megalurothrips usitatus TaxID=439358 RepID=A0AAV7Y4G4_9NEOP|nr:hypothetical protein ONE63_000057 [Megalurothrips usitatus]
MVRDSMQTVHDVSTIIRRSPLRRDRFAEIARECPEASVVSLRPLCPTRWTVRAVAFSAAIDGYPAVHECLEEIGNSKVDVAVRASGLAHTLEKGSTYLSLLICKEVFAPCELASTRLQKPGITVSQGLEIISIRLLHMKNLRKEETYDVIWSTMQEKIVSLELEEPKLPRHRNTPRELDRIPNAPQNHRFLTAKDKYRKDFFEIIDKIIGEIENRFYQEGIQQYICLEECILKQPDQWGTDIVETLSMYGINSNDLRLQLEMFPK